MNVVNLLPTNSEVVIKHKSMTSMSNKNIMSVIIYVYTQETCIKMF